jgi:zinc protease
MPRAPCSAPFLNSTNAPEPVEFRLERRSAIVSFRTPLSRVSPLVSPRVSLLAGLLAGALLAVVAAHGAETASSGDVFPFPLHETTLDNGLRIVVIPYDSPGTVAYYTVVRTGSRDEVEPGHSGFAHFFEHMMFRGTDRYPAQKYNDILKRMGADSNANTDDDRTLFHIVGPAAELETMIDLESDRFKNLKYSEEGFRTESLAVLGEYNKSVSNPIQPMFEKSRELAYQKHTYKHTTLGFLADIQAMPGYYDYSLKFFQRFYRPENCTLLVVGDAQPEKAVALVKKYYGDWKPGYAKTDIPVEPPQTAAQQAHIDWPNPTRPYMMISYHIPAFSTASVDSAALSFIDQLLFADSAPLYQDLVVKNQWVDFVRGGANVNRDPSLFTVVARAKSEELMPKVKATLDRYFHELQTTPVDPRRLERIKLHQRYEFALGLDTPGAVAEQAAEAIAVSGEIRSINEGFRQSQKATPEDVQRVARATFRADNETYVTLSSKAAAAQGEKGGAHHD